VSEGNLWESPDLTTWINIFDLQQPTLASRRCSSTFLQKTNSFPSLVRFLLVCGY
jgi:hypothetical protein